MKLPQLFQASAQTLTCTQFLGLNYTPEAAEKYAVRVARDLCYNNAKELVEEAYE